MVYGASFSPAPHGLFALQMQSVMFAFALLVCYCATGFASRLTGSLALAASAFFHALLQNCTVEGFNVFHVCFLLLKYVKLF